MPALVWANARRVKRPRSRRLRKAVPPLEMEWAHAKAQSPKRRKSGKNELCFLSMGPQNASKTSSIAAGEGLRSMLLLVHYFLPVAIGWSLALVMGRATGATLSPSGLALLLAGIGAAYSFDRLIDPPPASAPRPLWLHRTLFWGFIVCAGTMFILLVTGEIQPRMLWACGVLSAVSLLYSYFKRFPLAKTLTVSVAWTWAAATLPFVGGSAWAWLGINASLPLLLLLSAACILCDLKDTERDRRDRVPSLPALIGGRYTCIVATGVALAAAGIAVRHHRPGVAVASVLLAIAAQTPSLLARDPIGAIVIDSILVVPGLLIFTGVV